MCHGTGGAAPSLPAIPGTSVPHARSVDTGLGTVRRYQQSPIISLCRPRQQVGQPQVGAQPRDGANPSNSGQLQNC